MEKDHITTAGLIPRDYLLVAHASQKWYWPRSYKHAIGVVTETTKRVVHKARLFDTTQDTDYPKTCSTDNPNVFRVSRTANETHIVTVRQRFEWMVSGVRAAWFDYAQGTWKISPQLELIYIARLLMRQHKTKSVSMVTGLNVEKKLQRMIAYHPFGPLGLT